MAKLNLLLALILLAPMSYAQGIKAGNFTYKYDVASATATYCATSGQNGPFGGFIPGVGTIETSGSSTTTTGVDGDQDVFEAVGVGDIIQVVFSNGNVLNRVVVTNADNDTITVETAWDLSAEYVWSYKSIACGTGVEDGWIGINGDTVQLTVQYEAGDLDTLDVAWFCREGAVGSSAIRVYPGAASDCGDGTLSGTYCTYATTGQGLSVKIANNIFSECRIALKYGSTDGGTREEVTATISASVP